MSKSDPSARPMPPAVLRYGLSVLSVGISLGVTLLLQGYTFRTPLFFPAIVLSTWFGGTAGAPRGNAPRMHYVGRAMSWAKGVQERTADLSRSNDQLRIEIAERERAEGVLREQEALARQAKPLEQTHDDPSFEGWKSLAAFVRFH